MSGRSLSLIVLFISCFHPLASQTTYYSRNGTTNPAAVNSWTQDPAGEILLLPPADFSNPNDLFIIEGEFEQFPSDWTVAGTVQLRSGISVRDRRFNLKKLEVIQGISYFNYTVNFTMDTLIIGPAGQVTTNGITVNKLLHISGRFHILSNPIMGTGSIVVTDSGTLHIVNSALEPPGYGGIIGLSGSRSLSSKAQYEFMFNVGTFTTGRGLPDTVNTLVLLLGENTTGKINATTVVRGDILISGFAGGTVTNGSAVFSGGSVTCLGSVLNSTGNGIGGENNARLSFAGRAPDDGTESILPECTIPTLILNGTKKTIMTGNVTVTDSLILEQGVLFTGVHTVVLGVGSEGGLRRSGGHIVGRFSRLKLANTATSLLFPVGTADRYRPAEIRYTASPATSGLISVTHTDGHGISPLLPSLLDDGFRVDSLTDMFWQTAMVLVSGGAHTIRLATAEGDHWHRTGNLHVVASDVTGADRSLPGNHFFDTAGTAHRSDVVSAPGIRRYSIGKGPVRTMGSIAASAVTLPFGDVPRDSVRYAPVTIGNSGNSVVSLDPLQTGTPAFSVDSHRVTIAAHARSAVKVLFHPSSYGQFTDTLTMTHDGALLRIPLQGSSNPPLLTASRSGLIFGPVALTDTAVQTVKLYNIGSVNPLTVTQWSTASPVFWTVRPTPFVLPGNDSVLISMRFHVNSFTPNGYGSWFDTLVLTTETGKHSISLLGLSPHPSIVVTPQTLLFGPVKKDSTRQIHFGIVNPSVNILTVDSLRTGTKYFSVMHALPGGFVKRGDTVKVSISFTPDALGMFTDTLYIANNSLVSPLKIVLEGNGSLTGFPSAGTVPPAEYSIDQNFPNPFNPETTIRFAVPHHGMTTLKVYDAIGRNVVTLLEQELHAGVHSIRWDGRDTFGRQAASGVYFYRIVSGDFMALKRMQLLR